jgi:hypothetical protein
MISNTSITSTIGVTLMSETTGGAVFFSITTPLSDQSDPSRAASPGLSSRPAARSGISTRH